MDDFFSLVRRYGDAPDHELKAVAEKSYIVSMRQGEFFLRAGQVCHRVGLVLEGVFRTYVIDENGREVTRLLLSESNLVADLHSYRRQVPSLEYSEALTGVRLMVWDRPDLDMLERTIPSWHPVTANMAQQVLLGGMMERTEMLSDDAATRYRKFMERYPRDLARIPLRYLASYLGIAPQSLSRIRQQIGKH